jgi:hypothetical protein
VPSAAAILNRLQIRKGPPVSSIAPSLALRALVVAGVMATALPAGAQPAPFNKRPTNPLQCERMAGAPKAWTGFFFGRKEVDQGFIRYWSTSKRYCFTSKQDCTNWLYNMQSEYTSMVWRAECLPGIVPL